MEVESLYVLIYCAVLYSDTSRSPQMQDKKNKISRVGKSSMYLLPQPNDKSCSPPTGGPSPMMTPNLSKVARNSNPYLCSRYFTDLLSNQYAQFSPSCEHIFKLQKKTRSGPRIRTTKACTTLWLYSIYPRTLSTCFVRTSGICSQASRYVESFLEVAKKLFVESWGAR